jgi:DNA integrity scanning protein DisA with diadenylate cyclase activity
MNSPYNSNLKVNIEKIKNEMNKYSGLTRTEIFDHSINRLLKYTLKKYNNNIENLSEYLLNQEGMRVLKAITKIQKSNDKKVIQENMKGEVNGQHN